MRKLSFRISVISALLISASMGMDKRDDNEFSTIIERANNNPIAKRALLQEKEFRQETIKQINDLRRKIAKDKEEVDDSENWQKRALKQIEVDIDLTKKLNEALQGKKVGFSVKSNKIDQVLPRVQSLIQESFFKIVDGELPTGGYTYDQSTVTILGGDNTETIWGNSRGTYLKTALWYILSTRKQEEPQGFRKMSMEELDASALFHAAPLPESLTVDLSSYSFVRPYGIENVQALVFPHSGYAFGGHRSELRYPKFKRFGPLDCSHWFSVLMDCPSYTTADQLCAYWKLSGIQGTIPQDWEKGMDARYLLDQTEVVTIRDPQRDIQPGQIYCLRRFSDKDSTMTTTLGTSGHTALVLGLRSNNEIATLGYNRDMPNLEGFGLQDFSWASEPLKTKMLFRVKG